jgi:hypothetical protein
MMKLNTSTSPSKKTAKLLPVTLIGMGLTAAMNLPVLAADVIYHGNFCAPNKNSVNLIERNQFGVHNTSNGSTASVQCPFQLPFNASLRVTSVFLTVYDRNPSTNINCTLMGVGLEGSTIWTRTASSSGSGASHQFLSFTPPSAFVATMNMSCTLPAATPSGVSHITTYRVITTP